MTTKRDPVKELSPKHYFPDIHRGKFSIFQIKYNETILFFKENFVILTYINESTTGIRHI